MHILLTEVAIPVGATRGTYEVDVFVVSDSLGRQTAGARHVSNIHEGNSIQDTYGVSSHCKVNSKFLLDLPVTGSANLGAILDLLI